MNKLKGKQISVSKPTLIAVALAVVGLLIGLIGYMVAVSPEKSRIALVNSQIGAARASLVTAEQAPAKVKAIPAKASDLFRMSLAMPDTDDMPGLVYAIGQLAKSSSVSVQSVAPIADVPGSTGFSTIPFTVNVQGTFATVLKFMTEMRTSAVVNGDTIRVKGRLFLPTGVTITSVKGSTITALISADAFKYYVAPPVAPTTTDGTTPAPTPAT